MEKESGVWGGVVKEDQECEERRVVRRVLRRVGERRMEDRGLRQLREGEAR